MGLYVSIPIAILSCHISAATIGFERTSHTVDEDNGPVIVGVAVLSGSLSRDVVVRFNTEDDTARSEGEINQKDLSNILTLKLL